VLADTRPVLKFRTAQRVLLKFLKSKNYYDSLASGILFNFDVTLDSNCDLTSFSPRLSFRLLKRFQMERLPFGGLPVVVLNPVNSCFGDAEPKPKAPEDYLSLLIPDEMPDEMYLSRRFQKERIPLASCLYS